MHDHIEDVDKQLCEEGKGVWHEDEEGNGSCEGITPQDDKDDSDVFDGKGDSDVFEDNEDSDVFDDNDM